MNRDVYIGAVDSKRIIAGYQSAFKIDVSDAFKRTGKIKIFKNCSVGYSYYVPYISAPKHLYDLLGNFPWYYLPDKWEYDYAMGFLTDKKKIIEVGCGKGFFLKQLSKRGISAYGLDTNAGAIKELKRSHVPNVGNVDVIKYARTHKARFDAVCIFQTLEHIRNPGIFLKSCVSLIKYGGTFIVSTPDSSSFVKDDPDNPLNLPPHHVTIWDDTSLASLGNEHPLILKSVKTEPLQQHHWMYYADIKSDRILRSVPLRIRIYLGGTLKRIILAYCRIFSRYIKGYAVIAVYTKT